VIRYLCQYIRYSSEHINWEIQLTKVKDFHSRLVNPDTTEKLSIFIDHILSYFLFPFGAIFLFHKVLKIFLYQGLILCIYLAPFFYFFFNLFIRRCHYANIFQYIRISYIYSSNASRLKSNET